MQETIHTYEEHLRDRVTAESPEGRPAHPTVGAASFGILLALVAGALFIIGVAAAFFVQPIAAIVFAVLGLVVFAVNPQIWTALLRGQERSAVDRAMRDEPI
jgi:hypothetical protein